MIGACLVLGLEHAQIRCLLKAGTENKHQDYQVIASGGPSVLGNTHQMRWSSSGKQVEGVGLKQSR